MSKNEMFEHDSLEDNHSIGRYFQALIEGLEKGQILLTSERGSVMLCPGSPIEFSVKAKKKDDAGKLTIKLSWKDIKDKPLKKEKIVISS